MRGAVATRAALNRETRTPSSTRLHSSRHGLASRNTSRLLPLSNRIRLRRRPPMYHRARTIRPLCQTRDTLRRIAVCSRLVIRCVMY